MAENYYATPEPIYVTIKEPPNTEDAGFSPNNPPIISSTPTIHPIILPTIQAPSSTQNPIVITACPSPSSYAIDAKTLKPGITVSGPATIHPFDGSAEIAKAINMDWVPRWGINIRQGTSITIPSTVILLSGTTYIPEGSISIFSDNSRMEAAQRCWLLNHP